ncbi:hypothetical protein D3C71_1360670 [compost metagenome]
MMKSKPSAARSLRTFSTPSLFSASLSRVCEAASTNRLSKRLSLISACFSVASPWTTLTKSYTTRRSQPMIRSRLRRPTSKSMTATFLPRRASPHAMLALDVVLPTPPLPEVTTMISAKGSLLNVSGELRQSSAAIMIWSCSSHTCTALPRRLSGISSSTL